MAKNNKRKIDMSIDNTDAAVATAVMEPAQEPAQEVQEVQAEVQEVEQPQTEEPPAEPVPAEPADAAPETAPASGPALVPEPAPVKMTKAEMKRQAEIRELIIDLEVDPSQVISIHPSLITADPIKAGRYKRNKTKLAELTASMETRGQLEPAAITIDKEKNVISLFSGFGRREAALALIEKDGGFPGGPGLKCVLWNPKTEIDGFINGMHTNMKRNDLSPIDLMESLKVLRDVAKMSNSQIAQELGISRATVIQHFKLEKLPVDVMEKVHTGIIPARGAFDLVDLDTPEEIQKAADELIAEMEKRGARKVTSDQVREHVTKKGKAKGKKGKSLSLSAVRKTLGGYVKEQTDEETGKVPARGPIAKVLQVIDLQQGLMDGKISAKKYFAELEELFGAK